MKGGIFILIPIVDVKLTGRNIATLRTKRGITVRELQRMLGFATPQSIYKWQRGESLPTIENLAALACILAVPIEQILVVECYRTE